MTLSFRGSSSKVPPMLFSYMFFGNRLPRRRGVANGNLPAVEAAEDGGVGGKGRECDVYERAGKKGREFLGIRCCHCKEEKQANKELFAFGYFPRPGRRQVRPHLLRNSLAFSSGHRPTSDLKNEVLLITFRNSSRSLPVQPGPTSTLPLPRLEISGKTKFHPLLNWALQSFSLSSTSPSPSPFVNQDLLCDRAIRQRSYSIPYCTWKTEVVQTENRSETVTLSNRMWRHFQGSVNASTFINSRSLRCNPAFE